MCCLGINELLIPVLRDPPIKFCKTFILEYDDGFAIF